jgi:hypothetical protein
LATETAPIRYVAELVGADTDSERAIRWLIALMVLCCDPAADCIDGGGECEVIEYLLRRRAMVAQWSVSNEARGQ